MMMNRKHISKATIPLFVLIGFGFFGDVAFGCGWPSRLMAIDSWNQNSAVEKALTERSNEVSIDDLIRKQVLLPNSAPLCALTSNVTAVHMFEAI